MAYSPNIWDKPEQIRRFLLGHEDQFKTRKGMKNLKGFCWDLGKMPEDLLGVERRVAQIALEQTRRAFLQHRA